MRARGFTIIELLVTMTIVVILVGLLMAGAKAVRQSSIKSKSEAIVGMIANGLASAALERQSLPIVPHPLAGTVPTRQPFRRGGIDPLRQEERFWAKRRAGWSAESASGISGDFSGSATVPTTGLALLGGEHCYFTNAAIARDRLLANDVYANADVPFAFGVKRDMLGILSILDANVHQHLLVPTVDKAGETRTGPTDGSSAILSTAVDAAGYPTRMVSPSRTPADQAWIDDQEEAIRRALESVWSELGRVGAIRIIPPSATTVLGNLYRFDSRFNAETTAWQPGFLRDGGNWKSVSLPGLSLVDGFGFEICVSQTDSGRIRVVSPGKDGCLRVQPGGNKSINTSITRAFTTWVEATPPSSPFDAFGGDDRDATVDNLSAGVEVDDWVDRITTAE